MDAEKQSETARGLHAQARTGSVTCIDCHFGIAHKAPDGPGPLEFELK